MRFDPSVIKVLANMRVSLIPVTFQIHHPAGSRIGRITHARRNTKAPLNVHKHQHLAPAKLAADIRRGKALEAEIPYAIDSRWEKAVINKRDDLLISRAVIRSITCVLKHITCRGFASLKVVLIKFLSVQPHFRDLSCIAAAWH